MTAYGKMPYNLPPAAAITGSLGTGPIACGGWTSAQALAARCAARHPRGAWRKRTRCRGQEVRRPGKH